MMKISIAFLAALSLAGLGCHKDKNKAGESIAKLSEIQKKMCACKDKACTEKISEELTTWDLEQQKATGDKPVSPTGEDAEKIEAAKDKISECLLKLELPGSGAAGASGAAGPAGGAGGTTGSASPAAGSADGSAAGAAPAGGAAAGSAGGSAAPAAGSGLAH